MSLSTRMKKMTNLWKLEETNSSNFIQVFHKNRSGGDISYLALSQHYSDKNQTHTLTVAQVVGCCPVK